jgi:hypothetical protein
MLAALLVGLMCGQAQGQEAWAAAGEPQRLKLSIFVHSFVLIAAQQLVLPCWQ